jgi:HSP20 family protein
MTDHDKQSLKGRKAVDGILGGLGDILGKIAELADKAETVHREGGFQTNDGNEGRFHVGFNIRTMHDAGGERSIEVEPFGNVIRDRNSGEASVSERREPPTDIFEETDHILVVVEMPGIGDSDARFDVEGDVLTISAEHGTKRYHKELLLPRSFDASAMTVSAVNGVFEVKLVISDSEAA